MATVESATLPGWAHLELGGANYGLEGHSGGKIVGGADSQLDTLKATARKLITLRGPTGTFFINDLDQAACDYAAGQLRSYITETFPDATVKVVTIAKSYRELDVAQDCGVEVLDSIHLKNPDRVQQNDDFRAQDRRGWITRLVKASNAFHYLTFYEGKNARASYMAQGALPVSIAPSGMVSTHPLRYEVAPYWALLDKQDRLVEVDPGYLYVHPNGEKTQTQVLTRVYSFRVQTKKEEAPADKSLEVRTARQALLARYKPIDAKNKSEFERIKSEIQSHPAFALLNAFNQRQLDAAQKAINPGLENDFYHQVLCLDVLNFEDHKDFIEGNLSDANEELEGFKKRFFQALEEYSTKPISEIASEMESRKSSVITRAFMHSLTTLEDAWQALGLKTEFLELYPTEASFWDSDKTFAKVHQELLEHKAAKVQKSTEGQRTKKREEDSSRKSQVCLVM